MCKLTQFEKTVYKEISRVLDVPFNFKELVIAKNEKYEETKRVRVYQMKSNSLVITAPSLYDNLVRKIDKMAIKQKIHIEQLKRLLDLKSHDVRDRTIYLFLNPINFKEVSLDNKYTICKLDKSNKRDFEIFTAECPQRDLDEGLVSLEDPVVFGCFYKEKLVGIASFWLWGERIADIGIVVHPEYRKQGIGKALFSRLCTWGINNQKIILYRHNEKNKKSHQLALSLNFKQCIVLEDMFCPVQEKDKI